MPREMRAVVMKGVGGVNMLELKDVPLGWPSADNHVLVKLKAASVNPADIYFRSLGPDVLQQTFKAMSPYGRVVTLIGMSADTEDETAYIHNLTLHNIMMLTPMWRGIKTRMREQAKIVEKGMIWLSEKRLNLHTNTTFPLEKAAEAHKRIEAGGMTGKIVLTMGD